MHFGLFDRYQRVLCMFLNQIVALIIICSCVEKKLIQVLVVWLRSTKNDTTGAFE